MNRPAILIAALLLPAQAMAATQTLNCTLEVFDKDNPSGKTVPLTFTFDRDAKTLAVTSPWGDMSFANTMLAGDPAGDYGVRASGPATIIMPDKAAMEACLAAKGEGEAKTDPDMLALYAQSCVQQAGDSPAPVAASVTFEISVIENTPNIFFTRKYVEKSPVAGDYIELASFPLPKCTIAQ